MWNHISVIRKIKKIIPFKFKIILIRSLVAIQNIFYNIFPKSIQFSTNKKKIYFLLSTDYANLGDHAMSYASCIFFEKHFNDYEVIEISVNNTLKTFREIKKKITDGDMICLKGGGNIGIEYFREELIRRKIISTFKNNKIIIFPQTVYFPNTKLGADELNNTVSIYNSNINLRIFLRDRFSYDFCQDKLNNIYLVPDIVLSLGKDDFKSMDDCNDEKYISICMRDDVEGVYTGDFKEQLINEIEKKYEKVNIFDTIKPYYISINNRETELKKIIVEIQNSKVVITDRLHGMILAYIFEVPCIVLKTYNYKLTGQYAWLKDCNYIVQSEGTVQDILSKIQNMININKINKISFDSYFELITDVMRG